VGRAASALGNARKHWPQSSWPSTIALPASGVEAAPFFQPSSAVCGGCLRPTWFGRWRTVVCVISFSFAAPMSGRLQSSRRCVCFRRRRVNARCALTTPASRPHARRFPTLMGPLWVRALISRWGQSAEMAASASKNGRLWRKAYPPLDHQTR
jgi:hypothetical protein